jgi:hypothetical protein
MRKLKPKRKKSNNKTWPGGGEILSATVFRGFMENLYIVIANPLKDKGVIIGEIFVGVRDFDRIIKVRPNSYIQRYYFNEVKIVSKVTSRFYGKKS